MKILHLISQHPESTGSGFYLQNIIRQAAAVGHHNFLIAGISGDKSPKIPGVADNSCRFVRFGSGDLNFAIPGMSNVMPYPSSRFDSLTFEQLTAYENAFAETIRRVAGDFSPDILHSHHLWLVSAVARSILPDIPMVTSCHSTDLRQFVQCPHLQKRVRPHCRKIGRILALSRDQREEIHTLYDLPRERIDIVGGGYDQELFCPTVKTPAPPIKLLYAGKLSLAKGVDWLLRTFIDLRDPRLHLHLAGSGTGEETRQCLQLAEQAGQGVTMHGRITQEELAGLMGSCHIFILPSFYEGLPLVLLEALAAGCRIITTDLPGCRELLTGADPELVSFVRLPDLLSIDRPDPKDWHLLQAQLAAAISDMADLACLAATVSPAAISEITSSHNWQVVFKRIVSSYEKAMAD